MADSFLFNIAERVLEKIANLAVDEISLAFNVDRDLKKLEETMSSIKVLLLDAEQQQHQNERMRLCMWKLRDIFYDAEDVVDEFNCEVLQREFQNSQSNNIKVPCLTSCSSSPLLFSFKLGHKIKSINERLDQLALEWERFNLGVGTDKRHVVVHRETYSFVNSSDVIGRHEDKEKIVNLLLKPSEGENISVIPIVGIGGLGKTTLAQFVYNDESVVKHFPLRIWVCVSKEFEVDRLLKEIIFSITWNRCDHLSIEALQTHLRSLLNGKNFLLVLDDVWNEDRVKWMELRNLLMSMGAFPQSKIIVTTRSLKVASVVTSSQSHPHVLKGLSHEECMTLFLKWAFKEGDERRHPNLMRIGEEIVKKCKGLPLAVRTLGSLLFLKTDETEWVSIRDNEIWRLKQSEHDILPVLKLSYDHLPSHLQRCFTFLSLYKKDHRYHSNDVVQFWLANGLLEYPEQNQEWEDVGDRYLNELRSRCFIQNVKEEGFYFMFQMHDLMHDLAVDLSQRDCKSVSLPRESIDEKIRHLTFRDGKDLRAFQSLKKLKRVRTVVAQLEMIDKSFISFCASNFKYLRAFDLRCSKTRALPTNIGSLKHLQYLNLDRCLNLTKLPSSFYQLHNLITLKMWGSPIMYCHDRMQSSFPKLRSLEITKFMPLKVKPGCWSCLQYLALVECDITCLFEGIEHLTLLRTLFLFRCDKLVSLPRNLKYLTKLEYLQIQYCSEINLDMEPEKEESGLHLSLKVLFIRNSYTLKDLPRLLLEASTSTLQCITIDQCQNFEALPKWLPNLTSLQKLELHHCPKLSSLPDGMEHLTALTRVEIWDCATLSQRCQRDSGADWPKIAHVREVDVW